MGVNVRCEILLIVNMWTPVFLEATSCTKDVQGPLNARTFLQSLSKLAQVVMLLTCIWEVHC
jgi:hypothetical protein